MNGYEPGAYANGRADDHHCHTRRANRGRAVGEGDKHGAPNAGDNAHGNAHCPGSPARPPTSAHFSICHRRQWNVDQIESSIATDPDVVGIDRNKAPTHALARARHTHARSRGTGGLRQHRSRDQPGCEAYGDKSPEHHLDKSKSGNETASRSDVQRFALVAQISSQ